MDKRYDPAKYRKALEGENNVYLVMPSTSTRNIIPERLAARLQKDFGGEVIADFARPIQIFEGKLKNRFTKKLEDPATFEMKADLRRRLAGKNVVIVDDILATGDTVTGLREALAQQGIVKTTLAVITARDSRVASTGQLDTLAGTLAKGLDLDYDAVRKEVGDAFRWQFFRMAYYALLEARNPENVGKIYEVIRRKAEAVRARAEGLQTRKPDGSGGKSLLGGSALSTRTGQSGVSTRVPGLGRRPEAGQAPALRPGESPQGAAEPGGTRPIQVQRVPQGSSGGLNSQAAGPVAPSLPLKRAPPNESRAAVVIKFPPISCSNLTGRKS
ncbi:MAG: hypothetical protein HY360_08295 [Verrucomicrobia bacterium]|nr:hypothetical protein [Verrucomicrobiota bacterium]